MCVGIVATKIFSLCNTLYSSFGSNCEEEDATNNY